MTLTYATHWSLHSRGSIRTIQASHEKSRHSSIVRWFVVRCLEFDRWSLEAMEVNGIRP